MKINYRYNVILLKKKCKRENSKKMALNLTFDK